MKKLKPDFYLETDSNVFIIYKNFVETDSVIISGDKNILSITYEKENKKTEKTLIFPTNKFSLQNLHYEVNQGNLFLVIPLSSYYLSTTNENETSEISANAFYVIE